MRNIVDQMVHDISGKATVLSIMNELHSHETTQKAIDELINSILVYRKKFSNSDEINIFETKQVKRLNEFTKEIIKKSENILCFSEDPDIVYVLQSLIYLCGGFDALLNNMTNKDIITKLAKDKFIDIFGEPIPEDIIVGFLLILKERCGLKIEKKIIQVLNINYDFSKSGNGILNFLAYKYDLAFNLNFGENTLSISWKLRENINKISNA